MRDDDEGLRARKRHRTRQALEDAALRLFAERGFAATTVAQIAAEADVSERTFFHHFASKEDVVLGDFEARLVRLTELLATRPPDEPPTTAIRRALLEVAEDYQAERERLLLRARLTLATPSVLARSLELQTRWEEVIADTVAGRLGVDADTDLRPRLMAAVTLAAMRVAQRRWLTDDGTARLPELVTETLDLLDDGLAGLATPDHHDTALP
jgi:AcrR family transcriptional regulator